MGRGQPFHTGNLAAVLAAARGKGAAPPILAFDVETTGTHLYTGAKIFAYALATKRCLTYVGKPSKKVFKRLIKDYVLVMHNAKFDLAAVERFLGKHIAESIRFHDTRAQSHIVDNRHKTHGLAALCWSLCQWPTELDKKVNSFARHGDYSVVPKDLMDEYQRHDVARTMFLHRLFWPRIQSSKYKKAYERELAVIVPTMRMEEKGIMVRRKATKRLIDSLHKDVIKATEELRAIAGRPVNVNSPGDVASLLYDEIGLPILQRTEISGQPSTGKHVLLELRDKYAHPAVERVLEIRSKLKGIVQLEKYLELSAADGFIHPSINPIGATTGREACSNPNLQNVARTDTARAPYPIPARKCFRPRPGHIFLFIDYAGIELRLITHYAKDKRMKHLIMTADPHAFAAEIFYKPSKRSADPQIRKGYVRAGRPKRLRDSAKNAVYAICYGGGAKTVAETLGITVEEAAKAKAEFVKLFPGIGRISREVAETVWHQGRVETAFGRPIRLSGEESYKALNALIQGTAADIIKMAQVNLHKYLQKATGGEVFQILPIHDEIVFEVPRKRLKDLPDILKGIEQCMVDMPNLSVPLEIDIEYSTTSWEDKKPWDM